MPLPVSLKAIVEQLELAHDEWHAYINRKTGDLVSFSDEVQRAVEDGEVPEWALEMREDCRRALDDPDFIRLPTKYDIHEYEIVRRFCRLRDDEEKRNELLDAIAGRGAFRMFKSTIHRMGIEQESYRFRLRALKGIAAEFLEQNGIPYIDDEPSAPEAD